MKRVGIIISLFLGAVVLGALNPCLAEDKASPTDKSDKAAPAEKGAPDPERVLEQARQHIDAERFERAVELLKSLEPDTSAAAAKIDLLLGKIYLAVGKPGRADEFFEHAAFSTIDDAEAFLGMAQAKLALGKLSQAAMNARTALRSDADLIEAELVLAQVADRAGRVDEARQRLIELNRNQPGSEAVAVAYGTFLFQRGEEAEAISFLERFVAGHPQAAMANDLLGHYLWEFGREDEGLQYRTIAAKLYIGKGNDFRAEAIIAWVQARDARGRYIGQLRSSPAAGRPPRPSPQPAPVLTRQDPWPFAPGTRIKTGSGFIVGDGRYVVTNRHVVDGTAEVAVRNGSGQVRRARVVKIADRDDLAVLELAEPFARESAISADLMVDPQPGRSAVVMGFPLSDVLGDLSPSLTDGIVSKSSGFQDDPTTFQITAKMNKGNSGGPVFDRRGNLMGVAVAKLDVMKIYEKKGTMVEDVNLAIKISRVGDLLSWNANSMGRAPADVEMSLEELYQSMLPKVVMIAATVQ